MNDGSDTTTRRAYLKAVPAAVVGAAALGRTASTTGQTDTLLEEDFESYSVGSYPGPWQTSGNSDQAVIADPTASGEKALGMNGSYGGCWQALAHRELSGPIPADQTLTFRGSAHAMDAYTRSTRRQVPNGGAWTRSAA